MKLNLGCGPDIRDDYINIDTCALDSRVVIADIRDLPYDNSSIDEIYARDILEHLSFNDAKIAIQNWSRICRSGGKLFIQTICIDLMIEAYQSKVWTLEVLNYMLFAGKNWVNGISKPEDYHKSCYSKHLLEELLTQNNFLIDTITFDQIDVPLKQNPYIHNLNILINATKR